MAKGNSIDNQIVNKLGELKKKEGTLPQFIEINYQLLKLQTNITSDSFLSEPKLSKEKIHSRLSDGNPLLKFEDLSLDWKSVRTHFLKVVNILAENLTDMLEDAQTLEKLALKVRFIKQVTKHWFENKTLSPIASKYELNEEFLTTAIYYSLHPFLILYTRSLIKLINQNHWRRNYCPVCGGKPDFAYLDKEKGARWLLCSRCDNEWLFQRLECPYCGTQNHDSLAYYTDGDQLYRLYICDDCHSYIKTIDLRKAQTEILLPLERIITLDLDRQAEEAGYKPI